MRRAAKFRVALAAAGALALAAPAGSAELPKIEGQRAVASVNGEPIFLDALEREISALHAGHGEEKKAGRRQNPTAVLDRMVNALLISQEARNIGLGELPESKRQLERNRLEIERDMLVERVTASVPAPDPAHVERLFREAAGEFRVRSILIPKEADARELEKKLKAGGAFDALANALVKDGRAREGDSAAWLKGAELQASVATSLARMKVGETSGLVRAGNAWSFYKLLESRFPENEEARARAREVATEEKAREALTAYMKKLRESWATVDAKLLASLDYEKPGAILALEKDARTVARIRGGAPVTVADVTAGLQQRFFHGLDKAVEGKKVNAEKDEVLEDVLNRRVVASEAGRLGLASTQEFKSRAARADSAFYFDAFLRKVIVPDIKVEETDLAAYLSAHEKDFTGQEELWVEAIAFSARKDAEAALARLTRGADFAWTKSNAGGQVSLTDPRLVGFPSGKVPATSFPDEIRTALDGVREGDYKICGEGGGPFYVLHLKGHEPAKPLPLDAVRETVRKIVYREKLAKLVDDWSAKLRKASEVKVFATGDPLDKIILRDLSAE